MTRKDTPFLDVSLLIPASGKMAAKVFTNQDFRDRVRGAGFAPIFFLHDRVAAAAQPLGPEFRPLRSADYDEYLKQHRFFHALLQFRRFAVITETTDLRLRERLVEQLFGMASIERILLHEAPMILGRRLKWLRTAATAFENAYATDFHAKTFMEIGKSVALIPGAFNYGFWYEGLFAREAKRQSIPIVSIIPNYDNLLNMGFPGIVPSTLCVWSRQMADDAMNLHHIPASRIEVTGPMQYDRLVRGPGMKRSDFLKRLGLDPRRQTILYMGGVNSSRYYEILSLFIDFSRRQLRRKINIIVRAYPHPKVMSSPMIRLIQKQLHGISNVYVSDALAFVHDTSSAFDQRTIDSEDDLEEVNCLLHHSDVMISHFSTASLEAAICDLPSIHIAFDGHGFGQTPNVTAAFQMRQTHNRRSLRRHASKEAASDAELLQAIDSYLDNPGIDREKRRAYAESEIQFFDGESTWRVCRVLGEAVR